MASGNPFFFDPHVRGFDRLAVFFLPQRRSRFLHRLDQPALACLRDIDPKRLGLGNEAGVERDVGGLASGVGWGVHAHIVCAVGGGGKDDRRARIVDVADLKQIMKTSQIGLPKAAEHWLAVTWA